MQKIIFTTFTVALSAILAVAISQHTLLVSADILFGTYTPVPTKQGIPSTFGALNDYLTETDTSQSHRQTIRVVDIGWGPLENIFGQIAQISNYWRFDGAVICLSWQPYPYKTWTSPTPDRDIADGLYDDYIDAFLGNLSQYYTYARGASSAPRLLYLRFAEQPSADWAPWNLYCPACASTGQHINNTVDDYIAMWQHVIGMLRLPKYKLGPDVVQVVFDVPTYDASAPFEKFYPGTAGSVNWFSITGDNFGNSIPGNSWLSPKELLSSTIQRLQKLSSTLPIALSSVASVSTPNGVGAKEAWIESLFQFISTQPTIKMLTWYNADTQSDLAVFGGKNGALNWSSSVSSFSYMTYPAFKNGVIKAPYIGSNTSNPSLITQAQFFGRA